jgi:hypothetical protein
MKERKTLSRPVPPSRRPELKKVKQEGLGDAIDVYA